MLFELRNDAAERVSHCGVLEFIAEEGMIYMPYWVSIEYIYIYIVLHIAVAHLSLVLSFNMAFIPDLVKLCSDDGEPPLTRGRYSASEKCDSSKGNIC